MSSDRRSYAGVRTDLGGGVSAEWYPGHGDKKYYVELLKNGKYWKSVSFGNNKYEQYKDTTPLKLYSHKDHLDKTRRASYRARHGAQGYQKRKYSPAWFAWNYLW